MQATLTFPQRSQAEAFARAWSRQTKRGHSIGAGVHNVAVTVYDVTESDKVWISNFIKQITD